jgi:hypothetical protein
MVPYGDPDNKRVFPVPNVHLGMGITFRELVASMALHGLIVNGGGSELSPDEAATKAVTLTDALLRELSLVPKKPA